MADRAEYDCYEAFRRLDDFLDRELTGEEIELVKRHLQVCEVCASEFRFEGDVLQCLKDKMRHIALPPDLMQRISEALDKA